VSKAKHNGLSTTRANSYAGLRRQVVTSRWLSINLKIYPWATGQPNVQACIALLIADRFLTNVGVVVMSVVNQEPYIGQWFLITISHLVGVIINKRLCFTIPQTIFCAAACSNQQSNQDTNARNVMIRTHNYDNFAVGRLWKSELAYSDLELFTAGYVPTNARGASTTGVHVRRRRRRDV
jgi:hypothetical protein